VIGMDGWGEAVSGLQDSEGSSLMSLPMGPLSTLRFPGAWAKHVWGDQKRVTALLVSDLFRIF